MIVNHWFGERIFQTVLMTMVKKMTTKMMTMMKKKLEGAQHSQEDSNGIGIYSLLHPVNLDFFEETPKIISFQW